MKSLLIKRLPGILAVGFVALAVGAAGAPASASVASASGLTKSQAKQKKAALKKCGKKKTAKQRKSCKKAVNKKYNKLANTPPKGATKVVQLLDDTYNRFDPTQVNLKVNDSISWSWTNVKGFEPHNVTLTSGPSGVKMSDFASQTTASTSYTFKRQFTTPGDYKFSCSLHFGMDMDVQVSK